MNSKRTIRKAEASELPELMGLAARAMGPDRTLSLEEEFPRDRTRLWVACLDGRPRGYVLAWSVAGETEILEIAVDPSARRCGLGKALIRQLAQDARDAGDERLLLEVRSSNQAALALYKTMGFEEGGLRRAYYRNPTEDAVLMHWVLGSNHESEDNGG